MWKHTRPHIHIATEDGYESSQDRLNVRLSREEAIHYVTAKSLSPKHRTITELNSSHLHNREGNPLGSLFCSGIGSLEENCEDLFRG